MPYSEFPDLVLTIVFNYLGWVELKAASLVCRQWDNLVFRGPRMNRVVFIHTRMTNSAYRLTWLNSNRLYQHLELELGSRFGPTFEEVLQKLHTFGSHILTLIIWSQETLTTDQLLRLLALVPNLQELAISCLAIETPRNDLNRFGAPGPSLAKLKHLAIETPRNDPNRISARCPSLAKLKHLQLSVVSSDLRAIRDALRLPSNAPQLEGLALCNDDGSFADVLRHFSGQLKRLEMNSATERLFRLHFPRLEQLKLRPENRHEQLRWSCFEFFQMHRTLDQLSICCATPRDLILTIATHCRRITRLSINVNSFEPGELACLAQLTKLQRLEFINKVQPHVFTGCTPMASLVKVRITSSDPRVGVLQGLHQLAPQLTCLELVEARLAVPVVHFICENFSQLEVLVFDDCEMDEEALERINQLPCLRDLRLIGSSLRDYSKLPPTNVRYLTISEWSEFTATEMVNIPESFPRLEMFISIGCSINDHGVEMLRQTLPKCSINITRR